MTNATTHLSHATGRNIRSSSVTTTDTAIRLISQTAHDLRSPMTAVRESIRLVHDKDLGDINDDQKSMLAAAIDQCNCVDQMVVDMMQLDRLRHGLPRAQRVWVSISEVQEAIENTLRPWAIPREIEVEWESDDDTAMVFADPEALRRLVVNLVTNAIRVTAAGEKIQIVTRLAQGGEAVRWFIIDRGPGISESELRRIASRQNSNQGGEGLGLMICRQLAALHFSSLTIESRLESGTRVSFETPTGSPRAVASCWARWRANYEISSARPLIETNAPSCVDPDKTFPIGELMIEKGSSQVRPPLNRLKPGAVSVELKAEGQRPRVKNSFVVGTVRLGAVMAREASDKFDQEFQSQLRLFEMAFRVETRRWVWILDASENDAADRIEAITISVGKSMADLRCDWSDPRSLAVADPKTLAILSDLLVRQTLAASTSTDFLQDQVRLGMPPLRFSRYAASRLDDQVRQIRRRALVS